MVEGIFDVTVSTAERIATFGVLTPRHCSRSIAFCTMSTLSSSVGFLKSQERARFLSDSVTAAMRSLELAVLQYREGITDFTTVLTAQQALLSEQDSLATTLGDISGNLVGVYRALGGGWEIREGQDFVPASIRETMANRTNWGRLLAPAAVAPSPEDQHRLIRAPDW